jgi:hypothetical protein
MLTLTCPGQLVSITVLVTLVLHREHPTEDLPKRWDFVETLDLTDKWKISMNTNFDIQASEFSYTTVNVNRDLHCWQMAFNFVPFGYMKSYSFTINAKSSMLKDLRLQKRESNYDNF